jgi:glycine cleavage system aminomethyltransferase T
VLRADLTVLAGDTPVGVTTSGTFSPTLKVGIALALIDTAAGIDDGARVVVDVRGPIECEVVAPPVASPHEVVRLLRRRKPLACGDRIRRHESG